MFRSPRNLLLFAFAMAAMPLAIPGASTDSRLQPAAANIVVCRVLEAHTAQQPAVIVVVFHPRDKADTARLGNLLRQYSGRSVEFQTADGGWHAATVARLKSCFGRGLLLFPDGGAHLSERGTFPLKFPSP